MSTSFTQSELNVGEGRLWALSFDLSLLSRSLQQARSQAQKQEKEVLVCYTFAVPVCDALLIWRALRALFGTEAIFWEKPAEKRAVVGSPALVRIETEGENRFQAASNAWRRMVRDVIAVGIPGKGPLLFGGFRFDPASPRTELWQGYPDGLLVLPTFLFQQIGEQATLSVNLSISAEEQIETRLAELSQQLAMLESMVQSLATRPLHLRRQALIQESFLTPEAWQEIVAQSVTEMRNEEYEKVVFARGMRVKGVEAPFQVAETIAQLRQEYPGAYVFAWPSGGKVFLGATPERLIYGENGQLRTIALASSAARGKSEEEDHLLGEQLLKSKKTRQEHTIVVSSICEELKTLCSQVWSEETPHLLRLRNIQHLETSIVGELLPGCCVLDAIGLLHPTPAVGGFPRAKAMQVIREREQLGRGWYASPIGWIDVAGNGEFAVALRSALLEEDQAVLFAGCGIVPDSVPLHEYEESCLKFEVILSALGENREDEGNYGAGSKRE